IVSPSGTCYSYLGASSRMFYSMALSGQMPRWTIGHIHKEYNICRRSMLINLGLTCLVLFNSDSWASLMVIITGFIVIGYMAAPVSMGAINPKTRVFGTLVFIIVSEVMFSIPKEDLLKVNLAVMVLVASYGLTLIRERKIPFITALSFLSPFVIYLWALYFCNGYTLVAIVSALFYIIITLPKYVALCKKYSSISDSDIAAMEVSH
ncbi:MAG: hypothetical protein PHC75_10220, partial [Burkholderiales bacterium]|nr:hypothetical protein [Burkholderiales bacterium]